MFPILMLLKLIVLHIRIEVYVDSFKLKDSPLLCLSKDHICIDMMIREKSSFLRNSLSLDTS